MTVAGHPGGYGCNGEDTNHNQPRDWRSSELEETFTLPGGMVCPLHGKGYTDRRRAPPPPPPRLAAVARRRCRSRSASAALSQSHERHQATRDGSPDTYNPASATFTNDCDYFADERPSPLGYGWVEPGKGWTRSQRPTSSIPPDAAKKVKKSATLGNITSSDWFNVQSIRDAAWAMSYLSREGGLPRRQTVRPNAAREHPGRRGYHDAPKIVPPRGYDINSSTASRRPNAACLAETHIMQHKLDSARVYNRGLRVSNSELARQVIALRRKVEAIARPTGTASTRRLRSRSPCAGQKATDENAQDTASVTDSSNGNLSMKTDTARRDDDKTGGSPRSFRHNAPSQWHGRRRGEAEGGGLKQKLRSPRVESKSKKTPTEAQQTRRLAPTNVGLERESRQRPEAHAQTQTEVACLASVGGADPATTGRQYFAHQKRNLVVTAHEALTSATTTTNSRPEGTELAEESGAVAGALSSSERGDQMDYHHCHRHDTESLAGREEKSGAAGEEFYSCQGSEPEGRPNSGAEATIATQERTPRAYPVCSRASAARTPEVASSAAEVSPTAQERADPRRRVDAREVVASSTAEVSPATQDRADARRRIGAREIVSSKKEGSRREQGPRHDSKDSGAVGSVDAGLFPVRTRGNSGAVTVEPSARRGDELEGRPETRISPVSARGISGAVTVEPPARRGDELQGRQETRISPVSARGNSGAVKVEPSARRGDELQRRPENKSSISPVRARGDSGAFKVEPSARRGDELQGCPETRISPVPPRGTSGAVTVESSTSRGDELQGRPKTSISPVSARGNSGAVKVDPPARHGDELQGRPETSISPMSARGISGAATVEPRARRGDELQGRPEKKYSISPVPPRGASGAVTVESSTSRGDELQGRLETRTSPVSARGICGAVTVESSTSPGDELQGRPETRISPMSSRGISGAATVEPPARRGDELEGLSATSPGETRLAMVCHTPPPLWSGRSDGQAPPPPPPVPSDETRASPTERQIVEAEQTSRGATRQEGEADCKERPEKQRTETTTTTDTGNAGHAPKKEVEVEDLERKLHSTKRTLGAFKVALILARHRPIGRPNHPGDRFAALPAGLPRVALALSRWRTVPHPGGSRKLDLGSRTSGIPSTTTAGAAPSCEGSIEAPKTTATAAPVATGFFSERSSDTDGREEDSLADRARDGTAAQRESNEDSRLVAEKQRLRPPFPPMPPIPPAPRPRTVEPGAPPSVPAASWDELEQGRSACEGVSLLSLLPNHCSTAAVVGGTTAQAPPLGPNRRRKEGERPRAGYWRPAGGVGKQNDPATAMVITTGIPPPFLSPLEEGDENEEREQEQHCEHDNEAAESKDWSKDEVEGHGRETSIVREVAGALALKETSVHAGGARKTSFVEEAMNERVPATSDEQEPEEGTEEERLMGGHREERHRELYLADRKEEANVTSLVPTDDYAAQNQLFIELGAVADDGEGQSRASWTTAGNGEAAERFRQRHTVPQTGQEAGALNGRDEAPRFVAEREAADREEDREESDSSYRRDCAVLAGTAKIVFALLALEHRGVSSRFYRWKRTRHRPQKNRSSSIAGSTGNDHPLPDKRQGYQ